MSFENLIGETLGHYELRELIGIGGMGAVYRAYQKNLKREVAIKVISTALSQQTGYLDRFFREAQTSAALEDAHIIPIHDFGAQGQISYIVMRLLTGGSLAERMKQRAESEHSLPSLGEIVSLLHQIAGALDYAHGQGVIHRDIKPSNIMFDNKGSAFIVDFGVARLIQATTALTGTGTTLGTPLYMPPEQWRNENLTPASDQYALGIMVYQLVTGRLPFSADTPYALMHLHLSETPTPPQIVRADIPDDLALVLERALAKKPENRFPNVTAFAQAFERATKGCEGTPNAYFTYKLRRNINTGRPVSASGSKPVQPTSQPLYRQPVTWVAAVIVMLLIALIALFVAPQKLDDLERQQTRVALNITQTALSGNTAVEPSTAVIVVLPSATHEPERTAQEMFAAQPILTTSTALSTTTTSNSVEQTKEVLQTKVIESQVATKTAQIVGNDINAAAVQNPQAVASATLISIPTTGATTHTQIPTLTLILTPTLFTPTNTAIPFISTPDKVMLTITLSSANVRLGPGTAYGIARAAYQGMSFPAIGQVTRKGLIWYQVELPNGSLGWIASSVATLSDPNAILPLVTNVPPPPTRLPPTNVPPASVQQDNGAQNSPQQNNGSQNNGSQDNSQPPPSVPQGPTCPSSPPPCP